jgi:UDP-perosamine 4-acetyltransferase
MSRPVYIIGTGGHARTVLSIIEEVNGLHAKGLVEFGTLVPGEEIMGVPVVGSFEPFLCSPIDKAAGFVIATGDMALMRKTWRRLGAADLEMLTVISPNAFVDRTAYVGQGTLVAHGAYLGPQAVVGRGCVINTNAIVEHQVIVGDWCHLAPGSTLCGLVKVGNGVVVGANACILPNVEIADGVTLGAGATLVCSITERDTNHVGIPARPVK